MGQNSWANLKLERRMTRRKGAKTMRKAPIITIMLAVSALLGCGIIPGLGDKEEAQVPQAMPMQPGMPGQPAALPPGTLGQPAAMPGAVPAAAPVPPAPTGDALTDSLNLRKFHSAPDWQPTSALSKGRLETGANQTYQVQLPGPPYCHTYLAVADAGIGNLDLSITNAAGAVETQDATVESSALVQNHCPAMAGMYTVTVKASQGAGEFAVQVFSK
jgi:hypothetical protein